MPDLRALEVNGVTYDIRDPSKAPAGFGLGLQVGLAVVSQLAQLDTLAFNGWYNLMLSNGEQICGISYGGVRVDSSPYFVTQTVVGHNGAYEVKVRRCWNSNTMTWGEFEWLIPPMVPGVEYRTTERWNGSPVYAKLVNYGTAVNGSSMELPDGAKHLIRHQGFLNYTIPLPIWNRIRNNMYYYAESRPNFEGTCVLLETDQISDGFGAGSYTWQEQLWYTKD